MGAAVGRDGAGAKCGWSAYSAGDGEPPGTYGGGIQAFSGSTVASGYRATARALQPSRFFRLPSSELGRLLADWSPVAKHFLDGYLQRLEGIEATVRERERLISLGRLSAGLAHEVNNPAAAALRAAADVRDNVLQLQEAVGWIAEAGLSPEQLHQLADLQVAARSAPAPLARGAIDFANAEDEIGSWLDERDVENAWALATAFAAAGLDIEWLERAEQVLESSTLNRGLNWIAAGLGAASLVDQLEEALGRS